MNRFVLLLALLSNFLFAQYNTKEITDVSPDGKTINKYTLNPGSETGRVIKSAVDIPFGTTPDWTGALDRQIGGMAFADYDGDGDLDLATGCYFSNSFPPIPDYEVLIYRNDNGILTANPAWISADERSTTDIKFADIDGDGRMDLLACNGDNSYAPSVIYMNNGAGLPTSPTWVASPFAWSVGACFGDYDGDGDLDLAFANQGNSNFPAKPIYIFRNNFGVYNTTPDWSSVDQMITNSAAFGDVANARLLTKNQSFTGDGVKKVFHLPMLPLYSIDTVLINGVMNIEWCFDKLGGWISFARAPQNGAAINIIYKHISRGDLAVSKWVNYNSGVYFFENGSLTTTPGWTANITTGQKGIVWDDFDRDGYSDIAIGGSSIPIYLYKNNAGVMNSNPVWASTSVSPSSQELISGDLDNDGYPELACVHFSSKRIEVYKNRNGVLDATPTWLYVAGTSATSIAFGDVNGDGRLDLAVGTARTPVVVFLNQLAPVPVELTSFSVNVFENSAELTWSTATETNNKGFYVEKNKSGNDWEQIGFIDGAGTSTAKKNYIFRDCNFTSDCKYRLKQTDFDGEYSYSRVIEAIAKKAEQNIILPVYPNPSNEITTLKFSLPAETPVKIDLLNILGESILNVSNRVYPSGAHTIGIDTKDIQSGTYLIRIAAGEKVTINKLIVLR